MISLYRNWLNPEGITATELKKRTLTNLYGARPTWLANVHDHLDRTVVAAYGWSLPERRDQYSSRSKNMVALRSASMMTQILSSATR
jgi:hypothetical protein